jgi:hypothetical protein|nr:MAG TPA: PROTEIN/DNA Complex catalytic motif, Helix-turn-helix DNA [Caudoviricetes sp.]
MLLRKVIAMNDVVELLKMRGKISDSMLLDKIEMHVTPVGEIKKLPWIAGYAVTSEGQAISLEREVTDARGVKRVIKQRVLTKTVLKDGRSMVSIKGNPYQLSTLVARLFVPNPHNYRCVEHVNGDVTDDRADNLIWSQKGY